MARAWHLISRPKGLPRLENFELVEFSPAPLADGEVMVRNEWLSVDPYMRGRMNAEKKHAPPYELGRPMAGGGVGVVVESRAPDYAPGERVQHLLGWRDISVGPAETFKKIPPLPVPEQLVLHHLGIIGFTAWVGLNRILEAKPGETVFVSAAGGSVGSAVVQMAKIMGLSVIGSAGGPAKCQMVRNLGADTVIDYKAPGAMFEKLRAAAPQGIDAYFDNVGGDHLDAALGMAKMHARFALCGMVGTYNDPDGEPMTLVHLPRAVGFRLQLKGFISPDYLSDFEGFRSDAIQWIQNGQLVSPETIREGLEAAPSAFLEMFTGDVMGKMLVRL